MLDTRLLATITGPVLLSTWALPVTDSPCRLTLPALLFSVTLFWNTPPPQPLPPNVTSLPAGAPVTVVVPVIVAVPMTTEKKPEPPPHGLPANLPGFVAPMLPLIVEPLPMTRPPPGWTLMLPFTV